MTVATYQTVLALVQNACRQLSILIPKNIYASDDENAIIMGSLINNLGLMLWGQFKWQQFLGEFELVGDGSIRAFDLPADYGRLVNNTGWSMAMHRPVYLADAPNWNAALSQPVSITRPIFRLMSDKFTFLTPPANGEIIRFEYLKKYWAQDATGTLIELCTDDPHKPRFDWLVMVLGLKMLWKQAKGFDNSGETLDFNDRVNQLLDVNAPGQILSLDSGACGPLIGVSNLPDTGYGH